MAQAHGDSDGKLMPATAERLAACVAGAGGSVRSRRVYPGLGHGCAPEQLDELRTMLKEVLPEQPKGGAPTRKAAKGGKAAKAKEA